MGQLGTRWKWRIPNKNYLLIECVSVSMAILSHALSTYAMIHVTILLLLFPVFTPCQHRQGSTPKAQTPMFVSMDSKPDFKPDFLSRVLSLMDCPSDISYLKKKRMNLWVRGIPYFLYSLHCIVYMVWHALCSQICPSPGFNSIFRSTTFSRLFCVWRPESASLNFNKRCWRNILPLCWLFSRTLSIDVNLFTFCTHFLSNQLLDIDFEVVISLHQSYVFNWIFYH